MASPYSAQTAAALHPPSFSKTGLRAERHYPLVT